MCCTCKSICGPFRFSSPNKCTCLLQHSLHTQQRGEQPQGGAWEPSRNALRAPSLTMHCPVVPWSCLCRYCPVCPSLHSLAAVSLPAPAHLGGSSEWDLLHLGRCLDRHSHKSAAGASISAVTCLILAHSMSSQVRTCVGCEALTCCNGFRSPWLQCVHLLLVALGCSLCTSVSICLPPAAVVPKCALSQRELLAQPQTRRTHSFPPLAHVIV